MAATDLKRAKGTQYLRQVYGQEFGFFSDYHVHCVHFNVRYLLNWFILGFLISWEVICCSYTY